ncbi:MAG: type II toxin-antitoxin system HicA family toxin [Dehalococcoidia bacterium]|nr:type II toxin-antitoxin system HicA family toxin [Dehalococcoidia bacterium]
MPRLGPISRNNLIRTLHQLGFEGPYSGGKHQFMAKGDKTLRLPNPHQTDVGVELLKRILRQAEISRAEWEEMGE